ncbi:AAEL013921-PA [Aedes aegypti]|nr:AAEL013921-PA [Aedes aegypti]
MDEPRTHTLEVEKLIMETILGDTAPEEEPANEASTDHTTETQGGEEEGESKEPRVYTNEFALCKLSFHGQKREIPAENVVIRSTSVEEFVDQIFTLVKPHLQRGVYFPEPDRPCWFENELPTKEDFGAFIQFKDTIQKRTWRLENVDEYMLLRWSKRLIYLQVYANSTNIHSRAMWDLVQMELFGVQPESKKATVSKELQDEQRLQSTIKKLQKFHQSYLVPRTDDAFELWARLVMQQPSKLKRDICFDSPPKELLANFVVVGKENPKKRSCTISGPAQRKHVEDGFGFEDEVLALRHTVSQIKDLVEMLDKRVELLEAKSRGFRQTEDGVPIKKRKQATVEDSEEVDEGGQEMGQENGEPPIDVASPLLKVEDNFDDPDPLIFEDMIVKEEYDEIESDG